MFTIIQNLERHGLDQLSFDERRPANVIEAASSGAAVGLKIAVMVGAMLIAFVGLIALLNGLVAGVGGWFGHPQLSMQSILGAVLAGTLSNLMSATIAGMFLTIH